MLYCYLVPFNWLKDNTYLIGNSQWEFTSLLEFICLNDCNILDSIPPQCSQYFFVIAVVKYVELLLNPHQTVYIFKLKWVFTL